MSVSKYVSKEGGQKGHKMPDFRAVMGCYVEVAGEDTLYGVTCNHVTRYAAEDVIYMENSCKRILKFGQVLERRSTKETLDPHEDVINASNLKSPDIDIFQITSALTRLCKPVYRNASGRILSCRLYKGGVRSLYGKEIFKCFLHDAQKPSLSLINSRMGQIASQENHTHFESIIDLSTEFIVYGKDGNFAAVGDSGRMVAIEVDEDNIEIIGIILSGEYRSVGKESDSDTSVCICLLLEKGLEYLSREYGKEFTLSVSEHHTIDVKRKIEPNRMILYNTPEYSKSSNFDLVYQLLHLKHCLNLKVMGNIPLETIVQFEEDLTQKVFQRKDLEWKNVEYPTADQRCIHQALLACENIYSGNLKQAEKCLKEAYSMISRNCCFRLRLLCMMFCHSAWVMLETGNLEKACTLLTNGIPFMEEIKSDKSFPLDYLGSQYYVYSKYFNKLPGLHNKENAKRLGMKAIEVFEDNYRNKVGRSETLALAYSHYSHILLGFGEHCDSVNRMIEAKEINKAEEYLNEADKMKRTNNSVEEVYRLNTWGEYHYRRKGYEKATGCFKRSLTMAESMNLKKVKGMCNERLSAVSTGLYVAYVYKVVKRFMCLLVCVITYLYTSTY